MSCQDCGGRGINFGEATPVAIMCDLREQNYSTGILCNPDTGEPVIVVVGVDPAGMPTTNYFNDDGSPYAGPTPTRCDTDINYVRQPFCVNGEDLTRFDAYIGVLPSPTQTPSATWWTDTAGGIVTAPVPGDSVEAGTCGENENCETLCRKTEDTLATRLLIDPNQLRVGVNLFSLLSGAGVYCIDIDWGDNGATSRWYPGSPLVEHTYPAPGQYVLTIIVNNETDSPVTVNIDTLIADPNFASNDDLQIAQRVRRCEASEGVTYKDAITLADLTLTPVEESALGPCTARVRVEGDPPVEGLCDLVSQTASIDWSQVDGTITVTNPGIPGAANVRQYVVYWGGGDPTTTIGSGPASNDYGDAADVPQFIPLTISAGDFTIDLTIDTLATPGTISQTRVVSIPLRYYPTSDTYIRCLTGEAYTPTTLIKCDQFIPPTGDEIAQICYISCEDDRGTRIHWDESDTWDASNPPWFGAGNAQDQLQGGATLTFVNVMNLGVDIDLTFDDPAVEYIVAFEALNGQATGPTGNTGVTLALSRPMCMFISASPINENDTHTFTSNAVVNVGPRPDVAGTCQPQVANNNTTVAVQTGLSCQDRTGTHIEGVTTVSTRVDNISGTETSATSWGFHIADRSVTYTETFYANGTSTLLNDETGEPAGPPTEGWVQVPCTTPQTTEFRSGFDTQPICMEDANGKFLRNFVYSAADGRFGRFYDTEFDGETEYNADGTEQPCGDTIVRTEVGCLSDPASVDLSGADRCPVDAVVINGVEYAIDLDAGWFVSDLVAAVNAIEPGLLEEQDGNIVVTPGRSIGNLQIICAVEDFLETFGTRTGPLDVNGAEALGQPPMDNPGATTTYNFAANGIGGGPDSYGIHRVADMSQAGGATPVQETVFTMGMGAAATDSQGDPDGLVLGVDGSQNPGTMYAQTATGLVPGEEYQMRCFYADANDPVDNSPVPIPNTPTAQIALRIFDSTNTTMIAENDIGFITPKAVWLSGVVRFIATETSHVFRLDNASPVVFGNDLYVDHISFSRVSRQEFKLEQRGAQDPVEIVKTLSSDAEILTLRVYSPDSTVEYTIPNPDGKVLSTGSCIPVDGSVDTELDVFPPVVGYLRTCDPFPITLPVNQGATFSDNAGATSTVSGSAALIALLSSALRDAQEYEQSQIDDGQTVTNFFIDTADGSVFEFPPSAFTGINGSSLEFTTADLVAWPGPLSDSITQIRYSKFDNCSCRPVEMVQRYDSATNDLVLLGLFEPSIRDASGNKQEIITPLDFGITGPFAGPCPADEPALAVDPLCCDSDLAANNPDVANQRQVWVDGADASLMLDAIGGTPIAGNPGDPVFEVQDKISPGVAPSAVLPASVGGDTGATAPTFQPDSINGLPILSFNGVTSRLRVKTSQPPGSSFTCFYLVRSRRPVADVGAFESILAVGNDNVDGDNMVNQPSLNANAGNWQVSHFNDGTLVLSIVGHSTDDNTQIVTNVGTTNGSAAVIVPIAEFFNEQLHLLTFTYNQPTSEIEIFFDGSLVYSAEWLGMPITLAGMASDYYRLMGNRGGDFWALADLAELFLAGDSMSAEDISTVNAYLICKWGIDPTLAAGGAGDLTLAPDGTYSTPTALVRIQKANGDIVFRNTDTGLEFPVPPVPGLSVCDGGGDGCCTHPPLIPAYTVLSAGQTFTAPANTLHSLSVTAASGTVDVNGSTIPERIPFNVNGDDGQNNINLAHTIDNVTGEVVVITTAY